MTRSRTLTHAETRHKARWTSYRSAGEARGAPDLQATTAITGDRHAYRTLGAFTNPEATALGKKFNLPLRYDAMANSQAKAEASQFFAEVFKK